MLRVSTKSIRRRRRFTRQCLPTWPLVCSVCCCTARKPMGQWWRGWSLHRVYCYRFITFLCFKISCPNQWRRWYSLCVREFAWMLTETTNILWCGQGANKIPICTRAWQKGTFVVFISRTVMSCLTDSVVQRRQQDSWNVVHCLMLRCISLIITIIEHFQCRRFMNTLHTSKDSNMFDELFLS